jgi:hypothetical protein
MSYCNVWKLNCEYLRQDLILDIPIELDHELDLDEVTNKFKIILESNESFANKLKNGDLLVDMSNELLGYRMAGVYIIWYSRKDNNIEILNLSTNIDDYGYIPIKFSDLIFEKNIDYWHNIKKIQNNVYILNETSIIKQDYLEFPDEEIISSEFEFEWTNKYIPIFLSTITKYIKEQNVIEIEITGVNDIVYLLNIININNKKLGIISRKDTKIIKIRKEENDKYYFDDSLVEGRIRCICADIKKPDDIDYMNDVFLTQDAEKDIDYYYEIIENDEDIIESLQNQDDLSDDHQSSEYLEFINEVKKYVEIDNCIFKLTKSKYELLSE